jgi:hypothetical protein
MLRSMTAAAVRFFRGWANRPPAAARLPATRQPSARKCSFASVLAVSAQPARSHTLKTETSRIDQEVGDFFVLLSIRRVPFD